MNGSNRSELRWAFLALGMLCLLFSGIVYAWSILKVPFSDEFAWTAPQLALNFTLTMCSFCLGGIAGGTLSRRVGCRMALFAAALLSGGGFALSSRLDGSSIIMLYLSYGVMAGAGIGIVYNVVISTVSAWFPDKKGICSGCLMMAFGASALILGRIINGLMQSPDFGWRKAYLMLGISMCVVLSVTALIIHRPPEETGADRKNAGENADAGRDFTPKQMLGSPAFRRGFICVVFMAALGNTVISFARDLSVAAGASGALATSLVGVLSVCNGAGRIITGTVYDAMGMRKTMLSANVLCIVAASVILAGLLAGSLAVFAVGICLTGLSFGTCPTIGSIFTMEFFGAGYFPVNFSLMTFNLMGAAFIAAISSLLLNEVGSYTAPLTLLLALTAAALILNLRIRKP